MDEIRITASMTGYEDVDTLMTELAQWKNAHMYAHLRDVPEVERQAEIARLTAEIGSHLEDLNR